MRFAATVLPQSYQHPQLSEGADSCTAIKSAPSVAYPILAEFGGRCLKAMLGVGGQDSDVTSCHSLCVRSIQCVPVRSKYKDDKQAGSGRENAFI